MIGIKVKKEKYVEAKEQKQIEKDTIQRKELRYGYLIPSDWNYEK